ncbi:MAG: peptide synthase, partial [bacterium]|nr:peptide synthase [bacterium]
HNEMHKVADGDRIWHRMGDVGYFDDQQRFWFCGRKSHRVTTCQGVLFTIPVEAIFNNHPAVYRSALVGVGETGQQTPHLVVEPWPEHFPKAESDRQKLLDELRKLADENDNARHVDQIFIRQSLPVDIRHNSKIFREELRVWVARQLQA